MTEQRDREVLNGGSTTSPAFREMGQQPSEDIYAYCDRIEKALREHEERAEAVMQGSNCGIWDWDRANDIVRVSDNIIKLIGIEAPKNRMRLNNLLELIHSEDRLKLRLTFKKFITSGQRISVDCRFSSRNGEYIWVNLSGLGVRDELGRIKRIAGSLSDIDLRVAASRAHTDSEARFSETFANSNAGLVAFSMEGNVLFANRSFCKILGYTFQELNGKSVIDITHPDDRAITLERAARLMDGSSSELGFEKRYLRKDGSTAWVHVATVLHNDQDGMPQYFMSVVIDLSEKKKIEDEKQHLEEALRRSQTLETVGTMTSGLAHDLNKLLTPIIGYLDMTLEDLPADSPFRDQLSIVYEAAQHASDVVRQLLDFSRKGKDEIQSVKLSDVIDNSLKLLQVYLPAGVKIERSYETQNDLIKADYHQIHQVIMNLGANSGHAMREVGGTLRVRLTECKVDSSTVGKFGVSPGSYVQLEFSDSGQGMDAVTLAKIFDPFFTTKTLEEGTGLGLFVVNGIIRRHGGSIRASSEIGKGTTFTIMLPMATEMQDNMTNNQLLDVQGSEHILWIDDEPLILELGKQMLEYLGYRVTVANTLREATGIFEEAPDDFDLVITDSSMPGCSGETLAKRFHGTRSDIPIVLCSGLDPHTGSIHNYVALLPKPFGIKELARTVRYSLSVPQEVPRIATGMTI